MDYSTLLRTADGAVQYRVWCVQAVANGRSVMYYVSDEAAVRDLASRLVDRGYAVTEPRQTFL